MILLELFLTFFKIGAFTFGGGYAMLPLIRETVAAHGWLSDAELVDFIAVSESTPGPFAVNIATYVGAETGGFPGSVCATPGVVLPSFLTILIVAKCFEKFRSSRIISGCMSGLKPAVIGLMGSAAVSVGETVFFPAEISLAALENPAFCISLVVFLLSVVLAFRKAHPIFILCLSAALGVAAGYCLL